MRQALTRHHAWGVRLGLAAILLVALYFRTLNLFEWDSGTGQHPDERFFTYVASTVRMPSDVAELYDSSRSPLNPRNYEQFPLYVYGPMSIMLTRAVAVMLTPSEALPAQVLSIEGPPRVGADPAAPNERRTDYGPPVPNPERNWPRLIPLMLWLNPNGVDLTSYGEIVKVGRGLAAMFDLGSVLLVYLIGRRLFGRRVGLLAALLAALTVMHIQQSHFFVDPAFSTFFCLLALYWTVRVAQGGGAGVSVALGLSIGAAMANRITMATIGGLAIVAAIIAAQRARRGQPWPTVFDRFVRREIWLLIVAGVVTLLTFRTLAPDSFIGSRADSPLIGGPSLLHGAGFFDVRLDPRFRENLTTVRALVTGEYDFPPGQQWVGRPAYIFPWLNMVLWGMGPLLGLAAWGGWALFAARHARRGWQWALRPSPYVGRPWHPAWVLWVWIAFYFAWQGGQFAITMRYLLPIYGALIVLAAWALAVATCWGRRWLNAAATLRPAGWLQAWHTRLWQGLAWAARLALPAVLIATAGWAYAFSRIYTVPHSRVQAAQWLAEHAPPGSYVISERWDDPLPLQATSTAAWNITFFGIDSSPYAEDEPAKYFGNGGEPGLLDQLDRADYITLTSNRVYDSTSRLRMRYPALMRYYHSLFTGELGFELAAEITSYPTILGIRIPDWMAEEAFSVYDHPRVLIFRKTPLYSRERAEQLITNDVEWGEVYKSPTLIADRNPTALRLTESVWPHYAAGGEWWAWLGTNPFSPLLWVLWLEGLGLAVFAVIGPRLRGLPDRGFTLAKIVGLLLVAYLAWLAGSLHLAPFAPVTLWVIGLAVLGVGAVVGWRCRDSLRLLWQERSTALFVAELLFIGFLLLGLTLRWLNPDLWHPARGGEKPMDFAYLNAVLRSAAFPPLDPWHAGGYINYYYFGFVLVGALIHLSGIAPAVGYNLGVATIFALTAFGAFGIVYNLLAPRSPHPRREGGALLAGALAPILMLLLGNLAQAGWFLSGYAAEQAAKGRYEWAFWDATRITPGTINEFPFFTFLFADLHAHMIVMPLSLAALGLALAWLRKGTARQWWLIGLLGLVAGAIRATNTWDYPTFIGLAGLLLALATGRRWRRAGRGWPATVAAALAVAITPALLGNLLFAPFIANFVTESSGIDLWRGPGLTLLETIVAAERTTTGQLLQIGGHWLAVWLAVIGLWAWRRGINLLTVIGPLALLLVSWALDLPAIMPLLAILGVAGWLLWQMRNRAPATFITALFAFGGIGLWALVEVIVVRGDVGRMNTVFKFGLHAWMLLALATAAALPWLWAATRRLAGQAGWTVRTIVGVLLAAGLAYPITATPARIADRWDPTAPRTLDGMAFFANITAARNGAAYSLDEDAAAIDWLRRNARGTPIILEAHQPSYQWAGRIATFTGMPTLLGWEWHQIQQRSAVNAGPVIGYRQQIIATIYNTPDPDTALAALRRYGVEYIYVGGVERQLYSAEGLAKFATLVNRGDADIVFRQGESIIYRLRAPGQPRMLTNDLPIRPPSARTIPALELTQPVQELPAVGRLGWNTLLSDQQWLAIVAWLLVWYLIAGLGALPAYAALGRSGLAWARPVGLIMLGYAIWLPASLGLWRYDTGGVLGGLAVMIGISFALWRHGLRPDRATWRTIIPGELIFLAGFTAMALIRALNPDLWHPIWGGEKPMEQGFLNAILRSPVMPPYDPFYSNGYINYYYYGLYLMSLPIKLLGLDPAIGFNLALATLFGMLLAGAYELGARLGGRRRYGLVALGLIGLAGNLTSLIAAGWSQGANGLRLLLSGNVELLGDWFVGPSRVIPYTINEFPLFSFLYADLHPHVIALPLSLLAIACAWQLILGANRALWALSALTLGTLAVTNSWDFPTYGLLAGLAIIAGAVRRHQWRWPPMTLAAVKAIGLGIGSLLLFAPFFDRYWPMVRGIGLVTQHVTLPLDYILLYGLPLTIVTPVIIGAATQRWRRQMPARSWALLISGIGIVIIIGAALPEWALRIGLFALLAITTTLLARRAAGAPAWYALLLAWLAWAISLGVEVVYIRDHLDGGDWYRMNTVFKFGLHVWVLLGLAAAGLLPRLLAWLSRRGGQPAIAAALAIIAMPALIAASYLPVAIPSRLVTRFPIETGPTLDGMAFMEQASFTYDCNAFGGCAPGTAMVQVDLRGDAAAIRWLNQHINGTPIVAQSSLWFYRAYGIRVAAATGLPTVISALHADEQRDPVVTSRRVRDIETFFTTNDPETALRILARYNVDYVYIGSVERAFYPQGMAKFTILRDRYLRPVYEQDGVAIYQVTPLPDSYRLLRAETPPVAQPTPPPPPNEPAVDLSELEAAVAAQPTNAQLAFGLADAYRRQGRLFEAAQILATAAAANPTDVGLHHLWGDILADAGRYDEAEQAYLAAAQASPTAGNYNKLATALIDWGRLDKAEIALGQAMSIDPALPDPYFQLARLFLLRNQTTLAQDALQRYLQLAPDGPWAGEAQRMLANLSGGRP
ncbi:DUF2298 domain-containing protein [Chloroflexus sp.]|uniref:DUF2298 domain-containing protein n=1 Tax=Chloroflexus sp. TaxID=1904827 RepID=UPI00298ED646|nr:DUF2298 domain-containing protein [Chloroflexus sp.]MDW8402838.1 DUF2298 domain-containing protein [Chloroflexus sp.]